MLVTIATEPKLTVCRLPLRSRRRIVRMVMPSTSPLLPPISITSPMLMVPSNMKNAPAMTSLTSDCAPKPTARPMTPAPASSGAMSTPTSDRMTRIVIAVMTMRRALRISGSSVRTRAERRMACPESSCRLRCA